MENNKRIRIKTYKVKGNILIVTLTNGSIYEIDYNCYASVKSYDKMTDEHFEQMNLRSFLINQKALKQIIIIGEDYESREFIEKKLKTVDRNIKISIGRILRYKQEVTERVTKIDGKKLDFASDHFVRRLNKQKIKTIAVDRINPNNIIDLESRRNK